MNEKKDEMLSLWTRQTIALKPSCDQEGSRVELMQLAIGVDYALSTETLGE